NIRNLEVKFKMKNEVVKAVNDVSLSVNKGETVGLVGESGSGKSVTSLTVMGLNREALTEGKIEYKRENLLGIYQKKRRTLRGKEIAMMLQETMTALNPLITI